MPGENTRPLGPSSRFLGELVIPAGPAGNSLELRCYPPGPIPRLNDHCPVLLGILLVCRHLSGEQPGLKDLFVATSSVRPLLYHPVLKVCEDASKRQYFSVYWLCFLCREQFFISVSSRGHIWTSWSLKVFSCVCVCVCVRNTQAKPNCPPCVYFQRTVVPLAPCFRVVFFSANSREERMRVNIFCAVFFLHLYCRSPHSNLH